MSSLTLPKKRDSKGNTTLDWSESQYNCIIRMAIVVWVIWNRKKGSKLLWPLYMRV